MKIFFKETGKFATEDVQFAGFFLLCQICFEITRSENLGESRRKIVPARP